MNEQLFKQQFIACFCASWCANNYDEMCANNKHEWLNHPPIEDAGFLAQKAWEEYKSKFPTGHILTDRRPRKL